MEKLASYDVGHDGGTFQSQETLTQWDMVALLVSLEGYRVDQADVYKAPVDATYSTVYQMGVLPRRNGTKNEQLPGANWSSAFRTVPAMARLEGSFTTCSYSYALASRLMISAMWR